MFAGTFIHTGLGLGLGFLEEDLVLDLDLRIVDLDLHLDLAVAGLVTSLVGTPPPVRRDAAYRQITLAVV